MTKVLKLSYLGRMRLFLDETPLASLASSKAQALLCYLAVNGRSYARHSLAGLLWDEMPEADARRNLRGVLMRLRQAVEPQLIITHQTAAFNRESAHWLDVAEFRQTITAYQAQAQSLGPGIETWGVEAADRLQTAVSLYRGDFLEGFHVRQAPLFEAWVTRQRQELQGLVIVAYQALAVDYAGRGQYEPGLDAVRRWLDLDPVNESGHRQLMRLLARSGQRSAALAQYEICRQLLADELNVEPMPETAELVRQIRAGEVSGEVVTRERSEQGEMRRTAVPHFSGASASFVAGPPVSQPRQFFGRRRELKRIFNLLQRLPLQNAAIIGARRSGKTSLLHYLKSITITPVGELRSGQRRDWLPQPAAYRWVFVDFQDARMGQVAGLLRYLLEQLGLPDDDAGDLDAFLDVMSERLRTPTVILFDEIDVALARYPALDDAFWESLRSLATNQVDGNLAFILAAHKSPAELARHSGFGSPFFNIFGYTAVLGPLTDAEARELIASSPIPFPEPDVEWIVNESGGWPMPLQILCRERLLALEEGETGGDWRAEARRQMTPFMREESG